MLVSLTELSGLCMSVDGGAWTTARSILLAQPHTVSTSISISTPHQSGLVCPLASTPHKPGLRAKTHRIHILCGRMYKGTCGHTCKDGVVAGRGCPADEQAHAEHGSCVQQDGARVPAVWQPLCTPLTSADSNDSDQSTRLD